MKCQVDAIQLEDHGLMLFGRISGYRKGAEKLHSTDERRNLTIRAKV